MKLKSNSNMEYMSLKMKLDSVGTDGEFAGYASFFGNRDRQNDKVVKGAFKRTLKNNSGIFPMLFNHDPYREIALTSEAIEDEHGLYIKGRLYISDDPKLDLKDSRETYIKMKNRMDAGKPIGQSIGYEAIKWDYEKDENISEWERTRLLKEIRLWEISIVTFPANELATIDTVKSMENAFGYVESFIDEIKEGRVLSRANARTVKELIEKLEALLSMSKIDEDEADSENSDKAALMETCKGLAEMLAQKANELELKRLINTMNGRSL